MAVSYSKQEVSDQVDALIEIIQDRFDLEIGRLDAEIALRDLRNTLGVHAYNHGVADAQAYLSDKLTDLGIDVYAEPELQPGPGRRVSRKPDRP